MAINSIGENLATYGTVDYTKEVEDKTILGKDDFMKLLLVGLQYQDPTEPMDSDTILSQTSQLATLEATTNTNKALEDLATSLSTSQQFSIISAIGKTADLGSNAIAHDEGGVSSFEIYFPKDIASGTIEILDTNGDIISTIDIQEQKDENGDLLSNRDSGVYQFDWDGNLSNGSTADSGIYYVTASYLSNDATQNTTRMGTYPIESVRFEGSNTLVKVGSSYVNINDISEIY